MSSKIKNILGVMLIMFVLFVVYLVGSSVYADLNPNSQFAKDYRYGQCTAKCNGVVSCLNSCK